MRKAAAAVLLRAQIGRTFTGLVTGASDKGASIQAHHAPGKKAGLWRGNGASASGRRSASGCSVRTPTAGTSILRFQGMGEGIFSGTCAICGTVFSGFSLTQISQKNHVSISWQ